MTELSLDNSSSPYVIRGYQSGKIIVSHDDNHAIEVNQNMIITPEQIIYPWDENDFEILLQINSNSKLNLSPAVIILGTGEFSQRISPEKLVMFYQKNIGVEIMSTASACRTFNVLAAENRNVIAGLII